MIVRNLFNITAIFLIFAQQTTTMFSRPSRKLLPKLSSIPGLPGGAKGAGDTENLITAQNAFEGYNSDSTMDQINRNLRDDLLDKIEGMVKRLDDKVTSLEGSFGTKMSQIQQSVSGKLNKLVEKIHLQTAALKGIA